MLDCMKLGPCDCDSEDIWIGFMLESIELGPGDCDSEDCHCMESA